VRVEKKGDSNNRREEIVSQSVSQSVGWLVLHSKQSEKKGKSRCSGNMFWERGVIDLGLLFLSEGPLFLFFSSSFLVSVVLLLHDDDDVSMVNCGTSHYELQMAKFSCVSKRIERKP